MLPWILLLFGLALIVFGGDYFVRAAVGLAELWKLPRVVIGATLMSLATTSPEVVVSIMSGIEGESGLALGNAAGSVLCNIGLIAGLTAILRRVTAHPAVLIGPLGALLAAAFLALFFALDRTISRTESAILLAVGLIYFGWDFARNLHAPTRAEKKEAAEIVEEEVPAARSLGSCLGLFALGAAMVLVGSRLLVSNAVVIATGFGISPVVIGLTIVAIGTSLPELVTAITSARQNVSDLSIGNIIGANVANLTLVVGSAGIISPIALARQDLTLNFPALFLFISIFGFALLVRKTLGKPVGLTLLTLYGLYLLIIVGQAVL